MNRIVILLLASIAFSVAPISSSWATSTSQALGLCTARGADCSVANKGNNYEICVNNTGGRECVKCPNLTQKDQTCSVAKTKRAGGVTDIIKGSTKQTVVQQ